MSAKNIETQQVHTRWLIRCKVAQDTYALEMSWVRSIQRLDRLRLSPASPEEAGKVGEPSSAPDWNQEHPEGTNRAIPMGWIHGVGDKDTPVFSLAALLGYPALPTEAGAQQRIIVFHSTIFGGKAEQPWALLVEAVSQAIQVPDDSISSLPPIVINPARDYFQSIVYLDEALILLLSPERLCPVSARFAANPHLTQPNEKPVASPGVVFGNPARLPANSAPQTFGRLIVFSTGETALPTPAPTLYGLSISQVPEILEPLPIYPVPWAPAYVLGLVNWRKHPVPVIFLEACLGMAPAENSSKSGWTRLIIARHSGNAQEWVGFTAHSDIRLLRLPLAHRSCEQLPSVNPALIKGAVQTENETLVIPDVREILHSNHDSPLSEQILVPA